MASSHTVCSALERINVCNFSTTSPEGERTLIHSGRRKGVVFSCSDEIRSRVGMAGINNPIFIKIFLQIRF
jgi:hypothetical protein